MSLDVYAFGSALMDIQINVHNDVLDKINVQKGNMYLTDRKQQEEFLRYLFGKDITNLESISTNVHTAAGGSAANTVFGISQLGGKAALCGKVATDSFGALYVDKMKNCGVSFSGKMVEGMTGTCIILISDDAQRTMLTCLGVSSEITEQDINEHLLTNSQYVYLEGYLFDSDVATQTILKAIEIAKQNGVAIALTASDSFCVERHKDKFITLTENYVDLLFANADEAKALSDKASLKEAISTLSRLCKNLAITDGPNGSILYSNGMLKKIAPFSVTPRDTTGAGDSYAAGLLFGLTNGYTLESSGRIASYFSSRVVSQLGPRYSGNIRQEIQNLESLA